MGLRSSVQKSDGKIRNGTTRISERADGEIAVPQSGPSGGRCHGKNARRRIGKVQKELLEKLQEMNLQWCIAVEAEMDLASEFASKLRTVRSIPDAAMVCQEWMSRRFDMMTDDGERLFADIQKFMEAGSRLMANGSRSGGPDPGSTLST